MSIENPDKTLLANAQSGADLIVEADVGPEVSEFRPEQAQTLTAVVQGITTASGNQDLAKSWLIAQRKVEVFRPLPWFLWRLSLSVFSKPIGSEEINEGMILGLRRLLFAAASDPILGVGAKVNSVKKALSILPGDVIAAISIVHSVCRRLKTFGNDSIWHPILDDALVQAQIGVEIGPLATKIGKGRALLAGFAGPIGLALLVAGGDKKQAAEVIEKMSAGITNAKIGASVYGCEPIQISAMLLAAAGCGPDAATGIAVNASKPQELIELDPARAIWAAGCSLVESLRRGKSNSVSPEILRILGLSESDLEFVSKRAIKISRAGHSWQWIE